MALSIGGVVQVIITIIMYLVYCVGPSRQNPLNLDKIHYAQTVWYVRCRLSFTLLRASVMCLHGSRSSYHRPVNALRELAVVEGQG